MATSNGGSKLTHLYDTCAARMVDVGGKAETERVAIATGRITMSAEAAGAIRNGLLKKGDVIAVAHGVFGRVLRGTVLGLNGGAIRKLSEHHTDIVVIEAGTVQVLSA